MSSNIFELSCCLMVNKTGIYLILCSCNLVRELSSVLVIFMSIFVILYCEYQ